MNVLLSTSAALCIRGAISDSAIRRLCNEGNEQAEVCALQGGRQRGCGEDEMPKDREDKVKTVLVVDDDPRVRVALESILISHGYEVMTAADGRNALNIIAADKPTIVLADVNMPELEGIELLKSLRRLYPVIPVVIMSGDELGQKFLHAARLLGATDVLTKPFTPNELVAMLNRIDAGENRKRLTT